MAIMAAPSKAPLIDVSPEATSADAAFWKVLHGGEYGAIGATLDQLKAAYLKHPQDARIASHIAFLHVWRLTERTRLPQISASITDDATMARTYFQEAVKLAPHDARFRGFLASMTMAEGSLHGDEKEIRQGFFMMQDAVDAWPEFNLFTSGYVMSTFPYDSEKFLKALEEQWATLDLCVGTHVDRENLDFAPWMRLETRTGPKRACWNSEIAPHNFEGFFLNLGDMEVKAGHPKIARAAYAQAKQSKTYAQWPYRDVLDRRIAQAEDNVALFRVERLPNDTEKEHRMMIDTAFACMGCHQE